MASFNGLQAAKRAYELLESGESALHAVVEGVTLVEDDPNELTVGYGGLPNEDGIVELDAAVMDGATHRGAGVIALRGIRHPTKVARLVMHQTRRVLLTGEGALRFALTNGFKQEDLLTEKTRRMWLHWKRLRSHQDDWLPPPDTDVDPEILKWFAKFHQAPGGTVHLAALDAAGNIACATSTSGHAFKLAGRVGDSPILGAGLFADNEVGSCGSIGNGEANLENLSCATAVELMRGGLSPADAGLQMMQRVAQHAHPHQRNADGKPDYFLQFFLLAANGEHSGISLKPGKPFAIADHQGARLEECTALQE